MLMLGPAVNLQLLQHFPAELVLGKHAEHGFADDPFGLGLEHLAERPGMQAARVAGIAPVALLLGLQYNLGQWM